MKKGDKVFCNGYFGTIVEVCDGQLQGIIKVRLDSGLVCVPVSRVKPILTVSFP